MTIAATRIFGEFVSGTDLTSAATTTVWTPTSGKACFVAVAQQDGSVGHVNGEPTLAGNGLTWVQLGGTSRTTNAPGKYFTLFAAYGSGGTNGALTFNAFAGDNFNRVEFQVVETDNPDLVTAVLQIVTGKADPGVGGITIPITMTTGAALIAFFVMWDVLAHASPKAGWTETAEDAPGGSGPNVECQFLYGADTSGVSSWDQTVSQAGFVLELQEASGAPGPVLADLSWYIPSVRVGR